MEQLARSGTGDALAVGLTGLPDDDDEIEDVVVLPGDTPLLRPQTLAALVRAHRAEDAGATLLTAVVENPAGYGRVVYGKDGDVTRVVEEADATDEEKQIDEVNTSIYCFRRSILAPTLRRLNPANAQGEYYLTDAVAVLQSAGYPVRSLLLTDSMEAAGVNDRAQLAVAEAELRDRINERWMRRGVTMWDPERTYVDAAARLEADVSLLPGVVLRGACVVGAGVGDRPQRRPHRHGRRSRCGSGPVRVLPGHHRRPGARRFLQRIGARSRGARRRRGRLRTRSSRGPRRERLRRSSVGFVELIPRRRLELISGRAHPALANDIARHLGVQLGQANLREFANGEIYCKYDISIRGCDVFIVQTHASPVNDSLMEQLIMIDAAKRASAKRITAVCPYYGYSRQDRKSTGREPITAKLVADMLSAAGADRVISVDLHSGQIQGFFDTPFDHLVAAPVLESYMREHLGDDVVVVAPDAGRVKVAERYSQHLGCDLALIHKTRPRGTYNEVKARHVVGDVEGRHCVLIDDMIDTAGTICAAAELLAEAGASGISAMATHGVLSDPAVDRLKAAPISRVVVTDTLPVASERSLDKLEVLSVAKIIADAIDAVFEDTSVSELFGGDNLV